MSNPYDLPEIFEAEVIDGGGPPSRPNRVPVVVAALAGIGLLVGGLVIALVVRNDRQRFQAESTTVMRRASRADVAQRWAEHRRTMEAGLAEPGDPQLVALRPFFEEFLVGPSDETAASLQTFNEQFLDADRLIERVSELWGVDVPEKSRPAFRRAVLGSLNLPIPTGRFRLVAARVGRLPDEYTVWTFCWPYDDACWIVRWQLVRSGNSWKVCDWWLVGNDSQSLSEAYAINISQVGDPAVDAFYEEHNNVVAAEQAYQADNEASAIEQLRWVEQNAARVSHLYREDLFLRIAQAWVYLGVYPNALAMCQRINRKDLLPELELVRAECFLNQGLWHQARACLDTYEEHVGPNPELYERRARIADELREPVRYEEALLHIARVDPRDTAAAAAAVLAGEEDAVRERLAHSGRLEDHIRGMAGHFVEQGSSDGLLALLGWAREVNSPTLEAWLNAKRLEAAGEWDEALRAFRDLTNREGLSGYWAYSYVYLASQLGRLVDEYQASDHPRELFAWLIDGYADNESYLHGEELAQLVRLHATREPEDPQLAFAAGLHAFETGQLEQAVAHFTLASENEELDETLRRAAAWQLARVRLYQGQPAAAFAEGPIDVQIWFQIARASLTSHDWPALDALLEFADAQAETDDGLAEAARYLRAARLACTGAAPQALEHWRQLEQELRDREELEWLRSLVGRDLVELGVCERLWESVPRETRFTIADLNGWGTEFLDAGQARQLAAFLADAGGPQQDSQLGIHWRARCAGALGNDEEVVRLLVKQSPLDLLESNGSSQYDLRELLFRAYLRQGLFNEARQVAERAADLGQTELLLKAAVAQGTPEDLEAALRRCGSPPGPVTRMADDPDVGRMWRDKWAAKYPDVPLNPTRYVTTAGVILLRAASPHRLDADALRSRLAELRGKTLAWDACETAFLPAGWVAWQTQVDDLRLIVTEVDHPVWPKSALQRLVLQLPPRFVRPLQTHASCVFISVTGSGPDRDVWARSLAARLIDEETLAVASYDRDELYGNPASLAEAWRADPTAIPPVPHSDWYAYYASPDSDISPTSSRTPGSSWFGLSAEVQRRLRADQALPKVVVRVGLPLAYELLPVQIEAIDQRHSGSVALRGRLLADSALLPGRHEGTPLTIPLTLIESWE